MTTTKEVNNTVAELRGARLVAELDEKIERYARVSHYVLITGERGTGKTTIARRLHENSPRAKKDFVNLNCASLSPELLESELFGYEKGAFTGATAAKAGLFETASGGTIFLDEIGELPVHLQAKLLKAVEEKRIRRVGASVERTVDVRIIAATSRDLKAMVDDRTFRADLFDRLNVLSLETVPLRHQPERIKVLLEERLRAEQIAAGREQPFEISSAALQILENYEWRGNFRELLNFATRISVECLDEAEITIQTVERVLTENNRRAIASNDVPPSPSISPTMQTDAAQFVQNFSSEKNELITVTFDPKTESLNVIYLKAAGSVIRHVVSEHNGNLRSAAQALGANHTTLSRILKKYNQSYNKKPFHQKRQPAKEHAARAAAA